MKHQWLIVFALFGLVCCKKPCPEYRDRVQRAPYLELDTHDISKVNYYFLNTYDFFKNDTVIVTYYAQEMGTLYNPVAKGVDPSCQEYSARCQENRITLEDTSGKELYVNHSRQIPGEENGYVKVQLILSIGSSFHQAASSVIQDDGIRGVFDCSRFDAEPDLSNMKVKNRTYDNVYISRISHYVGQNLVTDSMYYAVRYGIIRAVRSNGDKYEFVW